MARGQPEGPFPAEVLSEDGDEALERALDGAMNHNRAGTAGGDGAAVILLSDWRGEGGIGRAGLLRGVTGDELVDFGVLRGRCWFWDAVLGGGGRGGCCFGLLGGVGGAVFEVELLRELKVELDGGALEFPLESVGDGDVDLGTVESAVAGVEFPCTTTVGCKLVESLAELGFGTVPGLDLSEELLRTRGKLQLECETEVAVDCGEEVKDTLNFLLNL